MLVGIARVAQKELWLRKAAESAYPSLATEPLSCHAGTSTARGASTSGCLPSTLAQSVDTSFVTATQN